MSIGSCQLYRGHPILLKLDSFARRSAETKASMWYCQWPDGAITVNEISFVGRAFGQVVMFSVGWGHKNMMHSCLSNSQPRIQISPPTRTLDAI
jgi:hypothetical protein